MKFLGDFAEDSTVYVFFTTHDGSGGAVAPSNAFEAADVTIYKNNSATQKTSTNGITMTSPFDSITGLHLVAIDISNDTGDPGFWATGNDYTVILNPDTETVDSQTVVRVLGQFAIENRFNEVDVTKWLGTAVATPATAGVPEVDVTYVSGDSGAADNLELDYDGTGYNKSNSTIGTCTTNTDMRGTDSALLAGSAPTNFSDLSITATTGRVDVASIEGSDATDQINAEMDQALVDIGLNHLIAASVTGTDVVDNSIIANLVSASATADWDDFVNTTDSLQAIRDVEPHGTAMRGTDNAALATVCTEARLAELAAANIPSDIDSLLSRLPATLSELSSDPGATPTVAQALMLLYMALKNNNTATATARTVKNNAGATVLTGTVSDDGTTFSQGKLS